MKILVATAAFVVLALGLALLPLESAAFTRVLVDRFSAAETTGLTSRQVSTVAEQVRAYVVQGRGELPATFAGVPAFDPEMVGHLDDVRVVLAGAQLATGLLAGLLTTWGVLESRRGRRRVVGRALAFAGVLAVALVVAAAAVAATDFDAFFTGFHGLFFAEGTWTFPWDSLLIQLFPESFWTVAGGAWGAAIVLVSAMFLVVARLLAGGRDPRAGAEQGGTRAQKA